jgi:hypothetical protein
MAEAGQFLPSQPAPLAVAVSVGRVYRFQISGIRTIRGPKSFPPWK